MLLSTQAKKPLEELILETLHKEAAKGPYLLLKLKKKDASISKETFYRILRSLLKEEVLSKHGKIYEINRHWLQRIYRFGKKHIESPAVMDSDSILSFKEGDKITYSFKNPNLMGIYWAHTYDMIFEQHDPCDPILVFHPHEWLIHTRNSAETFFLSRIDEDKKLVFFALGGNTPLDKTFKKDWSGSYLQINTGTHYGLGNTEYINVLGDFIFKVKTSKKFGNDLDTFFKKYKTVDAHNLKELSMLCNRNDKIRMTFTRSKKEADKWRAKFKKDFYVPKTS